MTWKKRSEIMEKDNTKMKGFQKKVFNIMRTSHATISIKRKDCSQMSHIILLIVF